MLRSNIDVVTFTILWTCLTCFTTLKSVRSVLPVIKMLWKSFKCIYYSSHSGTVELLYLWNQKLLNFQYIFINIDTVNFTIGAKFYLNEICRGRETNGGSKLCQHDNEHHLPASSSLIWGSWIRKWWLVIFQLRFLIHHPWRALRKLVSEVHADKACSRHTGRSCGRELVSSQHYYFSRTVFFTWLLLVTHERVLYK